MKNEPITRRMKEARDCVDNFIEQNGYTPRYIDIAKELGISYGAAHARLRNYRHKMIQR